MAVSTKKALLLFTCTSHGYTLFYYCILILLNGHACTNDPPCPFFFFFPSFPFFHLFFSSFRFLLFLLDVSTDLFFQVVMAVVTVEVVTVVDTVLPLDQVHLLVITQVTVLDRVNNMALLSQHIIH